MLNPATIDIEAVLQMVLASVVAGLGITAAFAFSVLGFARGPELRTQGRPNMGRAATALGASALLLAVAGIVVGLAIMAQDSPIG